MCNSIQIEKNGKSHFVPPYCKVIGRVSNTLLSKLVMSLRYLISLVVLIGIVLALPTSINKKPCPNNTRECIYRELLQRGLIKAAALPLSPSNGGHHVRLSPTLR